MRKNLAILVMVLLVALVIVGCKDNSERYYGKPTGSQQAQPQGGQYPVGAGCGVQAPPQAGDVRSASATAA